MMESHPLVLHQKSQPIHIIVKDLQYTIKGVPILQDINAHFKPNRLYALMGPSGAGKTTLMNVMCGRAGWTTAGQVLVNNQPMNPRKFKMAYKFIPQDDILFSALTPRETLSYTAEFLLSRSLSSSQRKAKVDALIHELHLESCADTVIGNEDQRGISGGQRKRVSVALELLTNPSVLFVDEPTSGLDSTTAEEIVSILRNLAHSGRTIICTIHQPSYDCFKMFDSLMLLNKGEITYFGAVSKSVEYFASLGYHCPQYHNPVEYFMDLVQGKIKVYDTDGSYVSLLEGKEDGTTNQKQRKILDEEAGDPSLDLGVKEFIPFEKLWKQTGLEWKETTTPNSREEKENSSLYQSRDDLAGIEDPLVVLGYGSSLIRQSYALFRRASWIVIRDKGQAFSRIFGSLVLGLLLGVVYLQLGDAQGSIQDRQSLLFMVVMFNIMNSLMTTAIFFSLERVMIFREYGNGSYHLTAYYISRICVACFFQCIYSAAFGSILYWMVGLYGTVDAFFLFLGTTMLLGCIGVALGVTVGTISPSIQMAQTFLPLMLMPLSLFSGFLVRPENIPIYFKWLYWISFYQYGYQIIAVNEFKDRIFDDCNPMTSICPVGPGVQTGETFLDKFLSYDVDDLPRNLGILGAWLVAGTVAGLLCMYYQATRKRN